jgi:Mu transposase, C-terminal domain
MLRVHEQRLGRHHTTANPRTGPSRLDALSHPAVDGRPPGDRQRVPESRGYSGAWTRPPERIEGKTGNFPAAGVHRPRSVKTEHFRRGVHRLQPPTSGPQSGGVDRLGHGPASRPCAERERLRAVPRGNRRGARAWAQRGGDLAGPSGCPRLSGALCQRPSIRRGAARQHDGGGPRRHHDRGRRRRPGGLRRRADGPAPEDWQVPAHAPLRSDVGYSRKSIRLLVWQSSAQTWAELHERAFRRLGGTVRVIVLDNLKEGVLTPDVYDPALNPLYRDVLAHYGAVALPCRVGDPDRKGKVESGIGHTQKTPLHGMRFETLEEAQTYLDRWDAHWADTRIHGTTKRQVAAMFADEQPALGPLPLEPFRYYRFGVRTVHLDGCVEVDAAYYSAPPGWIGRRVDVQWNDLHVRLLNPKTGQLLREHLRAPRGWHRIEDADRPSRTPAKTLALLTAAHRVGPSAGAIADHMHRHEGAGSVRRILGLLALAKKHGPAVVEEAAKAALDLAVPTYRFVRRYLERRPPVPLTLRQVDPLIRQLTLYRDLIDRTTGDPS